MPPYGIAILGHAALREYCVPSDPGHRGSESLASRPSNSQGGGEDADPDPTLMKKQTLRKTDPDLGLEKTDPGLESPPPDFKKQTHPRPGSGKNQTRVWMIQTRVCFFQTQV